MSALKLTMRQMLLMSRSARMFCTDVYSRQSSGSPSRLLASTVSSPCSCNAQDCCQPSAAADRLKWSQSLSHQHQGLPPTLAGCVVATCHEPMTHIQVLYYGVYFHEVSDWPALHAILCLLCSPLTV